MEEHLYEIVLSQRKNIEMETDQASRYNFKI